MVLAIHGVTFTLPFAFFATLTFIIFWPQKWDASSGPVGPCMTCLGPRGRKRSNSFRFLLRLSADLLYMFQPFGLEPLGLAMEGKIFSRWQKNTSMTFKLGIATPDGILWFSKAARPM